MRSWRRRVLSALLVPLVLTALAAVGAECWLRSWITRHGPAWLETQLESRIPLDVSIGAMAYSWTGGLRLADVTATDPATGTQWVASPLLHAHVSAPALLLRRTVSVRLDGPLTSPVEADVRLHGTVRLNDRDTRVDLVTSPIAVGRMSPALRAALPPQIIDGELTLQVHVDAPPNAQPTLHTRASASRLVWRQEPLTLTGAVSFDGRLQRTTPAPEEGPQAWLIEGDVAVKGAQIEGLPTIGSARDVAGRLRVGATDIRIEELRGVSLELPWRLTGTVALRPEPALDLQLDAEGDLDPVLALWPALRAWQPRGRAVIVATCHGPLIAGAPLPLRVTATIREGSVLVAKLPSSIERISGTVSYDHPTKTLTIGSLQGRMNADPVTASGTVVFADPITLDTVIEATTDLSVLLPWLPASSPVEAAAGPTALRLELSGPAASPAWTVRLNPTDAHLRLRGWPQPIDALTGGLHISLNEVRLDVLQARIADVPLSLSGSVSELASVPSIQLTGRVADGAVGLIAVMQSTMLGIEEATWSRNDSLLLLRGSIGRTAETPSDLRLSGAAHTSDLAALPWLRLPWIEAWQLDGMLALQIRARGDAADWRGMQTLGVIRSEAITIKGVPLRAASAELEQAGRKLSLRLTQAVLANGRLTGRGVMDWSQTPPAYLCDVDAAQLDLAALAEQIPAWKEKQPGVTGQASAHTSLLGTVGDLNSLHGDAWLKADGQQLVEVPLLKTLFKNILLGSLADWMGLSALRTAQISHITGTFSVLAGRVSTQDLALVGTSGVEPIALYVRGSVGFDTTLDLEVEPELSEQLVSQAVGQSSLASQVLGAVGRLQRLRRIVGRHHIGGTLEKPEAKFEYSFQQTLSGLLQTMFNVLPTQQP